MAGVVGMKWGRRKWRGGYKPDGLSWEAYKAIRGELSQGIKTYLRLKKKYGIPRSVQITTGRVFPTN